MVIIEALKNGQGPDYKPPRVLYRRDNTLGATILSSTDIEYARRNSDLWGSETLEEIETDLNNGLPGTHGVALWRTPVKKVVSLKNGDHTTLALQLESKVCDNETQRMAKLVLERSGVRLEYSEVGAHISLAKFMHPSNEKRFEIPGRVIRAVEQERPPEIDLAALQVQQVAAH
jgi:hypothetical protein